MEVLFPRGQIVATPGALDALARANQTPEEFLRRHAEGDCGELPNEDKAENLCSLKHGFRVFSSYRTTVGDVLWVVTEADRATTVIFLPQEF